ncbi:MAG TPA: HD domain-containing protein [Caproicibacter sp.]|nr:HD domain-containing protein [Caproicibacter sp.]
MQLTESDDKYFQQCAKEILGSQDVRSMSAFVQHAKVSTLDHCISVAYVSLWLSEKMHWRINRSSLIRGALLHDFFLYDWHLKSDRKGLHGFTHPRAALENAEKRFQLNDCERDIIIKHMWPLTPVPPRYRESVLVGMADKYCSLVETLRKHTVYRHD